MADCTPNLLLITADDMNWDAVGCFGCPVPGTSPNIDRLAAEGMRFHHAHVTIAVCQPSRSVMMTGMYPHKSGGEGFFRLRKPGIPLLPEILRDNGFTVGILGKLTHSTPYEEFRWDMEYDQEDLGMGRNPEIYEKHARTFISEAQEKGKPFFLMANSHDPHRPFYGNDKPEWYDGSVQPPAVKPSKTFTADEVTVPGCLPDLPEVNLEIAEYYNSVRRCDDTIGKVLDILEETGTADNTLILFLSDNGMAFPFAKTNCYLNSTRTPWIMRWPNIIEPGRLDQEHFVAGIDILPTFLEAAGIESPEAVDGISFLGILKGGKQERDKVFTQFNQTAARNNYPMRCIQTKQYGYIFNPWSDGKRLFKNESQAGRTMKSMRDAADADPNIAERVQLFLYRVPEELYDFDQDPDGLNNLINDPAYTEVLNDLRGQLEDWMRENEDPTLEAFQNRDSAESKNIYLQQVADAISGNSNPS